MTVVRSPSVAFRHRQVVQDTAGAARPPGPVEVVGVDGQGGTKWS